MFKKESAVEIKKLGHFPCGGESSRATLSDMQLFQKATLPTIVLVLVVSACQGGDTHTDRCARYVCLLYVCVSVRVRRVMKYAALYIYLRGGIYFSTSFHSSACFLHILIKSRALVLQC